MKVTKTTWTIEGTVAEIKAVLPQLDENSAVNVTIPSPAPPKSSVSDDASDGLQINRELVDFLKLVMTRRKMPWGQQDLFAKLYPKGDVGMCRSELAPAMDGRSDAEFSGVIGALGHRTSKTPGHDELAALLHHTGAGLVLNIEQEGSDWRYALRPEARVALEELGKVAVLSSAE